MTRRALSRELTPLGQGSGTVELENLPIVEVAFLIKVIVDRGMSRDEFLKRFDVPKFGHRSFSSSERLMRVFGTVVEPTSSSLADFIADHLHRCPV